ncbi:hypothetical protein ASV53_16620 [Photobacterium sanguinicancri]|uniref:Uncharacterized protein n=1 Tax=Photobacterium sanguinicancri TaxID=875932 RepID=A0ABX4FVJ3_9GAMM|nr:hypothetical protein ASV53_16620 [Photobacterium sanguinicancri]
MLFKKPPQNTSASYLFEKVQINYPNRSQKKAQCNRLQKIKITFSKGLRNRYIHNGDINP